MTAEELKDHVFEHDREIGELKVRVKKCEDTNATLQNLSNSIIKIDTKLDYQGQAIEKQGKKIDEITAQPGKNLNTITISAITTLVGGILGYIISVLFK